MIGEPRRARPPQWLWVALVWLGIGIFDATQTVVVMRSEGMHHAWTSLYLTQLLGWLPWAVATPLIARLGREHPLQWLRVGLNWIRHLFAWAAVGLVSALWGASLERWLNPWANADPPGSFVHAWFYRFNNGLLAAAILYATILIVTHMLDSRERLAEQRAETARLNEQLSKAQLDALRRQIEPHFLFNTLNAISGLVREQRNDAAVGMIAGLSDFLRRVLKDSNRQQVPLGEEVEFLRRYLEIEKVRFGERLQLSVDVPQEFLAAEVPSLILQPMVENAVKHGIARRAQGGAIRVRAFRSNGMLTLSVYNDGPSLSSDWYAGESGIGLSNMRTRLESLYGEHFELQMKNREPGGVEASVSVPWQTK